jgi:hypothetical protein
MIASHKVCVHYIKFLGKNAMLGAVYAIAPCKTYNTCTYTLLHAEFPLHQFLVCMHNV